MNTKDRLIESEENPNFEADLAEQSEFKKQYDAKKLQEDVLAAKSLLLSQGYHILNQDEFISLLEVNEG